MRTPPPGDEPGAPEAPAPEAPPAVWEDFIDIFYAPAAVYDRRRGVSPWPVLLVLTLLLTALFVAWQRGVGPLLDVEMQRAAAEMIAENPEITAGQLEQMSAMGRGLGVVGFALAFPMGVLVVALVTWGLTRAFGAAASFTTLLMVVTYAQLVHVPAYGLGLFQSLVLDLRRYDSIQDVSFSLARFLDQPEASLLAVDLAARVDLFTLWATALIAIGVHTVTDLPRARAWTVALLVWLLGSLPSLIGALMDALFGG